MNSHLVVEFINLVIITRRSRNGNNDDIFTIETLTLCDKEEKEAVALSKPSTGGRVAVRAASSLPETAYVKQRPFKDSLRVKKHGVPGRFFDKDVDAFFVND
ncbi:hypothetical protein HPB48_004325 [Haemaphysalis longicornis]|uniref:Uncharacterized protein n=1 Tax=Haemaphysalis longicornis TaxID=44386 RepID=A0A9J6FZZ4_HAELO|nr:hypothetical protein HPB48_004325 [Haemaphysalis longicornis]